MRHLALLLIASAACGAPVAALIDISAGGELTLQRGQTVPVVAQVGAALEATDVLKAKGPCQATLLYDAAGPATLEFADGHLEVPVGEKPAAAPDPSLSGAVGKTLTAAFGATSGAPGDAPRGAVEAGYILGRLSVDDVAPELDEEQAKDGAKFKAKKLEEASDDREAPSNAGGGSVPGEVASGTPPPAVAREVAQEMSQGISRSRNPAPAEAPRSAPALDPFAIHGLPATQELSRWKWNPAGVDPALAERIARLSNRLPPIAVTQSPGPVVQVTPVGDAGWTLAFTRLDDIAQAKVAQLTTRLTGPAAPKGGRLVLARWCESKGLVYAALFEYRRVLNEHAGHTAYRAVARHAAALAFMLGDRRGALAISQSLK